MTQRRRIAITGLGTINALGRNCGEFWTGLSEGRSGVGPITQYDPSAHPCRIASEVRDYDPKDHFDPKLARQVERFAQFAIIASREAWTQSGLAGSGVDMCEAGCVMGGGVGGIAHTEEAVLTIERRADPSRVSPFLVPRIMANASCGQVSIDLGLKGPNFCLISACAAGTNAIGEAAEIIRRGDAQVMIGGGSEASICSVALAGFEKMKAVCTKYNDEPTRASRPFDADRCGFVMGEGAGALVLEDWDFARARGAKILAELTGYGLSADAYHITAPAEAGEGGARAMRMALKRSGLRPEEIGYINAHGTSTDLNDKLETAAIKTVFGDHARKLAISSNKSMVGHVLGGAGGVEGVATVLTLLNQVLPPTINLDTPDPECDLDYVPGKARPVKGLKHAMSNSLGFGGHNCVAIFSLPESE